MLVTIRFAKKKLNNPDIAKWIHDAVTDIKVQRGNPGRFIMEFPPAGSIIPPTPPILSTPGTSASSGTSTLNPILNPQTTSQTEKAGDADKKKGE